MSRVLIRLYLCYLACAFFVISVYFYYHAYDLEKGFGLKKIKSTIATLICSMATLTRLQQTHRIQTPGCVASNK